MTLLDRCRAPVPPSPTMPYDTSDVGVRRALELAQAVVACKSVPETPATAAAAARLGEHGRAALAGMISCAPAGVQPVGELADLALVCTVQPGNRLACRACVSGKWAPRCFSLASFHTHTALASSCTVCNRTLSSSSSSSFDAMPAT